MNTKTLYTDGSLATEGRFKAGAWAVVWQEPGGAFGSQTGSHDDAQSSNEMELRAVLAAVSSTPAGQTVCVVSDCQAVVEAAVALQEDQVLGSRHRAYPDLWEALSRSCAGRTVTFRWVRGHGGSVLNAEANRLAREAARVAARQLESAARGARFLRAPVPVSGL